MSPFRLLNEAIRDIEDIWEYIAKNNLDAANQLDDEIERLCQKLADRHVTGSIREHITSNDVRFFTIPKFRNYTIVYRPEPCH